MPSEPPAPAPAPALDDRESECCGHLFQTRRQRVDHEQRVIRGLFTKCPCGDVCSEGEPEFTRKGE